MASPMTVAKLTSPVATTGAEERQRRLTDFRHFYLEHIELVRRVVARLCGCGADVDDLVQEVFLVALRRRADFAGRAAPSTWLYAIARRVVMAQRRRARFRQWLGMGTAAEPTQAQGPHELFEHREASRHLYALLDRLSEKKRTVFILHEIEGLPGETIAGIVGCPAKTVWTRLHHARRELQILIAEVHDGSRT